MKKEKIIDVDSTTIEETVIENEEEYCVGPEVKVVETKEQKQKRKNLEREERRLKVLKEVFGEEELIKIFKNCNEPITNDLF